LNRKKRITYEVFNAKTDMDLKWVGLEALCL